jgi:predicted nucleic acid-binding protein
VRVVDASIVLQWLLETPSKAARTVLEDHVEGREALVAPELLRYEVGNVLVRKTRLAAAAVTTAFDHFLDLEIQTYSLGTAEYRESLRLAGRYKLTMYDAGYVALAVALGVEMITADQKLARATAPLGIVHTVS